MSGCALATHRATQRATQRATHLADVAGVEVAEAVRPHGEIGLVLLLKWGQTQGTDPPETRKERKQLNATGRPADGGLENAGKFGTNMRRNRGVSEDK